MLFYMTLVDTPEQKCRFKMLYDKYKNLMYSIAFKILQNTEDSEDAVQEAFFTIARNIDKFQNYDCHENKGLIVIITENKAIDIYRKRKSSGTITFEEEYMGVADKTEIEQFESRNDLAKAIALLPEQWGDVLQLRYAMGYSVKETAMLMSISESNVRKIAERAKKSLAKKI